MLKIHGNDNVVVVGAEVEDFYSQGRGGLKKTILIYYGAMLKN